MIGERRAGPSLDYFAPDLRVPNSRLPVLIYRDVLPDGDEDLAPRLERLFRDHGWSNAWRDGVYPFHHYHSTAHEVLGIARGEAKLRLGGESGRDFDVRAGQVLLLPAGTGHKCLSASPDLLVVGAYPGGRPWDLIRADQASDADTREAMRRIAQIPLPNADPVTGAGIAAWAAPA